MNTTVEASPGFHPWLTSSRFTGLSRAHNNRAMVTGTVISDR